MNYALILAGGIGSRFWPLSKEGEPKQFLSLCSAKPMIEETLQRLSGLIRKENIYIATNQTHSQRIRRCANSLGIPLKNILFEPQGKNTLAPVCLISSRIMERDKKATIVVLPSDHYIKRKEIFLNLLKKAIVTAQQGYIVTFGARPCRPETGYGYIKVKGKRKKVKVESNLPAGRQEKVKVYAVDRFVEKPNLKKAKEFLKDKRYYWNCGIFIFRADMLLGEVRKFAPVVYKIIKKIKNNSSLKKYWSQLPSISLDYAVMEKTKIGALLTADCGWMDLGSWEALDEVLKRDRDGNILRGNCLSLENKNTLIWSDNRLVAALGLDNIVIVNTEDAVLVCRKEKSQDVKKIVGLLKLKNPKR